MEGDSYMSFNKVFKSIKQLDEKTKFVKRVVIKALLENRMLQQVPVREDSRIHYLNDYSTVKLYGKCHKCKWEGFVEADPVLFFNKHIKNSAHGTCPICEGPELHVSTELPPNRKLSLTVS
jgi:hypothetical protein